MQTLTPHLIFSYDIRKVLSQYVHVWYCHYYSNVTDARQGCYNYGLTNDWWELHKVKSKDFQLRLIIYNLFYSGWPVRIWFLQTWQVTGKQRTSENHRLMFNWLVYHVCPSAKYHSYHGKQRVMRETWSWVVALISLKMSPCCRLYSISRTPFPIGWWLTMSNRGLESPMSIRTMNVTQIAENWA